MMNMMDMMEDIITETEALKEKSHLTGIRLELSNSPW
jgi:hypothetical protein